MAKLDELPLSPEQRKEIELDIATEVGHTEITRKLASWGYALSEASVRRYREDKATRHTGVNKEALLAHLVVPADNVPRKPRILLWDIETSPNLGYTWGKWEQNVISFEAEWHLLCIGWKWLGDKTVHVAALPDFERYTMDPSNDYELTALAHTLFDAADIVIAHNGTVYDTKKAQARMAFHGMEPPSPFREVDTLKLARRHFAFVSNKLNDLCEVLGIGKKVETGGFNLWLGCLRGDPVAWSRMKRYNRHDVALLEDLYLRLRPWAANHPNLATIANRPFACPRCNSEEGMIVRGYGYTGVSRKIKWQCKACGGYSSSRVTERLATQYV